MPVKNALVLIPFLFFSYIGISADYEAIYNFQKSMKFNDSIQPILSREVIYFALKNEIQIWVTGAEKVDVKNKEVKKIDDYGTFVITVVSPRLKILNLEIEAVFPDRSIREYKVPIKVKIADRPYVEINGFNGKQTLSIEKLRNAEITVSMKDPFFDNRLKVHSFKIYMEGKVLNVNSNTIDDQTFELIKTSNAEVLNITNVSFSVGLNLSICKTYPLTILIKD